MAFFTFTLRAKARFDDTAPETTEEEFPVEVVAANFVAAVSMARHAIAELYPTRELQTMRIDLDGGSPRSFNYCRR